MKYNWAVANNSRKIDNDLAYPSLGICMIATNSYIKKWFKVASDLEKISLEKLSEATIHLFTDNASLAQGWALDNLSSIKLKVYDIQSWGWPEATLLRYKFITEQSHKFNEDLLMYLDCDMRVLGDFSKKLYIDRWTSGIALVQHPGFYRNKGLQGIVDFFYNPRLVLSLISKIKSGAKGYGTWETNKLSTAFVPRSLRKNYFHGAVWFGRRIEFLRMCEKLALNVNSDLENNYTAIWHDESHLNNYAAFNAVEKLNPEFSGVPSYKNLRKYEFLIISEEKKFGEGRTPTDLSKTHV